MGDLIELAGVVSSAGQRLALLRRAARTTDDQFRAALAEELGWPGMSAAVLAALEAGCPEPTADVMAAAERVLARTGSTHAQARSLAARVADVANDVGNLDLERLVWPTPHAQQLEDYQAFLRLCALQRRTMSLDVLVPAMEVTYSRLRALVLDGFHPVTRATLVVAADASLLAGRLYYFAGRRGEASRALAFADAIAHNAGADHVRAAAQVAISYLQPVSSRLETLDLLTSGVALSGQASLVKAWILARRAEEHAVLREETSALRDLDAAAAALSKIGDDPLVGGPRTTQDLDGFRGSVLMHLGRPEATQVLERSLDSLPADQLARRAHTLIDLGTVRAQRGDVDAACAALKDAVSSSARAGRIAYVGRAASARRRHLSGWHGHPAVNALDEQLRCAGAPRLAVAGSSHTDAHNPDTSRA